MGCVRLGGAGALVGAAAADLVLDTLSVVGKRAIWVLEGNADPKEFIPRMIDLWQAGEFPFDRLIEEFPLVEIDAAEEATRGRVVKPVLRSALGRARPQGLLGGVVGGEELLDATARRG